MINCGGGSGKSGKVRTVEGGLKISKSAMSIGHFVKLCLGYDYCLPKNEPRYAYKTYTIRCKIRRRSSGHRGTKISFQSNPSYKEDDDDARSFP
jgi:hypothetical protein